MREGDRMANGQSAITKVPIRRMAESRLLFRAPIRNGQEIHEEHNQAEHDRNCQDQEDVHPVMATKPMPSDHKFPPGGHAWILGPSRVSASTKGQGSQRGAIAEACTFLSVASSK